MKYAPTDRTGSTARVRSRVHRTETAGWYGKDLLTKLNGRILSLVMPVAGAIPRSALRVIADVYLLGAADWKWPGAALHRRTHPMTIMNLEDGEASHIGIHIAIPKPIR